MYNVGEVLILGGNRFVGKALAKKIVWEYRYNFVDVFNRSGTGPRGTNIIQGDRNNREDLEKIDWDKYDTIVDMCLFKPEQFQLIEYQIPKDTNYIFVSSGAADERYIKYYGDYGHEKREVEMLLKSSDLNYKIVRPSYIVGIGNHRPRLGYYMNKIINKEFIDIDVYGENIINVVFVQDVVDYLIELVCDRERKLFTENIVGENITVVDLISKVSEYCKDGEVLLVGDNRELLFPKNDFEFNTDNVYTTLDDGLKEYSKWYYEKGYKEYEYNI